MERQFRGLFLDLSGVVYEGDTLISGARDVIAAARDMQLVLRFVTNTATKSLLAILDKLEALGIDARPDELFTAPAAARAYLLNNNLRPFLLVHPAISGDFDGVVQSHPNCVVLGDAREQLNFGNLNRAFQLCKSGAPLVAIGMNRYYQTPEGLQMDAGGFVKAVAWAAQCSPVVMGKPSAAFFAEVVKSTSLTPQECLMVGDDVEGDVLGALEAGMQGCLVKTGKYQTGDESRLPEGARVIDSIAQLF